MGIGHMAMPTSTDDKLSLERKPQGEKGLWAVCAPLMQINKIIEIACAASILAAALYW